MPNAQRITAHQIIQLANDRAIRMNERAGSRTDWARRHVAAFSRAATLVYRADVAEPAGAVVNLIVALGAYADAHYQRYETAIGTDGVLGQAWAEIAQGILTLLNGDLGPLDGGTCDGMIREIMRTNNINPDTGAIFYEEDGDDA
ncbi:MAG TPA: hypothetical protein VH439_17245 [Gemmatimonadales bacterium]|jgi:hypothetical protein